MCRPSTLQTTNEMVPACPLNPSGVRALRLEYRTVRPAFGDATPQLRPHRHSRRHRSGQPPLAPVSRGRNGGDVGRPSPVAPFIAEARAVDARFHARITLPPVSSSRDPLEQLEGYSRGMTHASCRGRRVTNSRSSSIQRCPRASPIDRASPQPRLGRPEGRSNPGVLACATTPAARRGDAERETTIHMARHVNRYLVAGGIELTPSASRFLAYHSDSRVAPRRATGPLW